MAAKKDSGAPAALKAVEDHELQCRIEKDAARLARDHALEKMVEGDDVSERTYRQSVALYDETLGRWDEALKRLNLFDKSVREERRSGETVLVEVAKEVFAQYDLSLALALEAYIVTISQQASLCESPEAFYKAHADTIRATRAGAIEAAKKEGALPAWVP
jgi:hypothetical protein